MLALSWNSVSGYPAMHTKLSSVVSRSKGWSRCSGTWRWAAMHSSNLVIHSFWDGKDKEVWEGDFELTKAKTC